MYIPVYPGLKGHGSRFRRTVPRIDQRFLVQFPSNDPWCAWVRQPFVGLLVYRYTVYIRIPTPSISQDVPGHLAGECQV